MQIHGDKDDHSRERTWLVRGSLWRQAWETSRPATWGLYDASTGALTIVSPSDKTFTPLQQSWAEGPGYLAGAFHKVTITDREEEGVKSSPKVDPEIRFDPFTQLQVERPNHERIPGAGAPSCGKRAPRRAQENLGDRSPRPEGFRRSPRRQVLIEIEFDSHGPLST